MPAIKLHLDDEEYDPILRLADELHLAPEDVVYAATNRLMLSACEAAVREEILYTKQWRGTDLPSWCDSARSVHAYEGKADDHSVPASRMNERWMSDR